MTVDNCAVYILNSLGEIAERGQLGEIYISGAHVADGYVKSMTERNSIKETPFSSNTFCDRKGKKILLVP